MVRWQKTVELFLLAPSIVYVLCQFDIEWDKELQRRNKMYTCGIKGSLKESETKNGTARMINGKPTTNKIYPWAAEVFYSRPTSDDLIISAGTIISNRAIISCKHCICNSVVDLIQNDLKMKRYTIENISPDLNDDFHTCLSSEKGNLHPVNQNRNENVIRYRIGTNSNPTRVEERYSIPILRHISMNIILNGI